MTRKVVRKVVRKNRTATPNKWYKLKDGGKVKFMRFSFLYLFPRQYGQSKSVKEIMKFTPMEMIMTTYKNGKVISVDKEKYNKGRYVVERDYHLSKIKW